MLFELINSTVADVSRKESVDYHAVDNMLERYIETKANFSKIKSLGILGLDEISLKKGYKDLVTLITYRIYNKGHIFGEVKGREKAENNSIFTRNPSKITKHGGRVLL